MVNFLELDLSCCVDLIKWTNKKVKIAQKWSNKVENDIFDNRRQFIFLRVSQKFQLINHNLVN